MTNNPWVRRAIVGGLLLLPGVAFAAVELSGSDVGSLCSLVSSLFSCGGGCPYSGG